LNYMSLNLTSLYFTSSWSCRFWKFFLWDVIQDFLDNINSGTNCLGTQYHGTSPISFYFLPGAPVPSPRISWCQPNRWRRWGCQCCQNSFASTACNH
jgi:hypothetical protein